MDFMTTLAQIPGIGPYLPYLTLAVTIAAALATVLPPPPSSGGFMATLYGVFYHAVSWLALNKGKASNANALAATKPPSGAMNTLGPIAFLLATGVALSGCAIKSPAAGVTIGAGASPSVVDVAAAVYPKSLAAVNAVCPAVQNGLSILASCVSGGAAGSTGTVAQARTIADASCTEAGKLDLAANDTKAAVTGPTATNSGDSAGFLVKMFNDAAAIAPVACPLAKALLKQ